MVRSGKPRLTRSLEGQQSQSLLELIVPEYCRWQK
ncbi:hypothetical protein OOU_Y34scaffold00773g16 [Pyricularia oryzae Y34]|uniref:Uncharacterized protein n=3 Tax=Pyricularia oryzae TaxID=318829 RepID=A0A4P7N4D1_PYROR|nr:hypothetical protein OOU_Y34scaffold00773g16 [Pyricularia oryzae Y34]QBZ57233.1 hypothetical protein PoMZ_02157 [Pyricularia oryzae]